MASTSNMSRMTTLQPLDTALAFDASRSASTATDLKSPFSKTSAFPKTAGSAIPRTPVSAYPKTPLTSIPNPRMLSRQATTRSFDTGVVDQTEALAYGGDDGALTKTGSFLYKIHKASVLTRYSLYVLPVAMVLAIPVVVTASPPHDNARADGIRLLGLFIWTEIVWVALWISKLLAKALPILFQAACALISTGIRKYSLVLKALELPLMLLFWTLLCFGSTDVIVVFDKNVYHDDRKGHWVTIVKHIFRTGILAASILIVEKTIIQLISINYYRKQYARKIRESKRLIQLLDMLYDASRILFPEFSKDFVDEDTEIHTTTFLGEKLARKGTGLGGKILSNVHKARAAAFGATTGTLPPQSFGTPRAHSVVTKALENEKASKALARRLFLSLCASGKDAIYKQDIQEVLGPDRLEEADEIFDILDRDGNGDVSLEEMTILIVNCGNERKDRASSIQDISVAISVLDKILTTVVIIAIGFIYALFFSKAFASKSGQLWTSVASLAFSIGGTVTEFFACCIFLFVKHPYDVGDRVTIEKQELIVKHISLMYSIFKRVEDNSIVQIPHNIANTLWIGNVTRSKAMTERIKVKVSFATKMEDILALRKEMENFVNAPENRHDFQPDFDIELISVDNLYSLELRVEIRHKSNWANEQLRLHRRNKFMCELNAAFRRVPIERPLGNWGPANPTYTCELSNAETLAWQKSKSEEVAATRLWGNKVPVTELFPKNSGGSPAQAMFPGLKRRSPHGDESGRRPSIWSPL